MNEIRITLNIDLDEKGVADLNGSVSVQEKAPAKRIPERVADLRRVLHVWETMNRANKNETLAAMGKALESLHRFPTKVHLTEEGQREGYTVAGYPDTSYMPKAVLLLDESHVSGFIRTLISELNRHDDYAVPSRSETAYFIEQAEGYISEWEEVFESGGTESDDLLDALEGMLKFIYYANPVSYFVAESDEPVKWVGDYFRNNDKEFVVPRNHVAPVMRRLARMCRTKNDSLSLNLKEK